MAFVKITKLKNVKGRAAYAGDASRQGEILCRTEPVDWSEYADHEKAHRKSKNGNNEALELTIALPNAWATFAESDLLKHAAEIAAVAVEKSTDTELIVRWNAARTNLHMHVIFSERTKLKPTDGRDVYRSDVYLKDDGKVTRKKAERAKDKNGNERPPVHRKGESKGDFTAKDKKYKSKNWLAGTHKRINAKLGEMGYPQREREHWELREYHQGKGPDSEAIAAKNEKIRKINKALAAKTERYDEELVNEHARTARRWMSGKLTNEEAGAEHKAAWKRYRARTEPQEPEKTTT